MAESKGSLLAKSVQKHAGRAKEKILQNLGKVDRTADDIFDEHLQNFTKQQNAANRLQKEFNNYIRCIRNVQTASKTLMDAIGDIYESQWSGHDLLYMQTQSIEMLWQDFSHKLADQVMIPLNTYQGQFPEMRKKIDKRGRKLVDYDSQRHSFQALQANMSKKRDDVKVMRGREQLEEAKRTYEVLNSELHDELPALYDSRVLFLVTNLQTLFASEQVFHSETSKVFAELEAIVDKLATESQRGSYTIKKNNGTTLPKSPNANSTLVINNGPSSPTNSVAPRTEEPPVTPTKPYENKETPSPSTTPTPTPTATPTLPAPTTPTEIMSVAPIPIVNGNTSPSMKPPSPATTPTPTPNPNPNLETQTIANNNIPAATTTTSATSATTTTTAENTTTTTVSNKNVEELYDIPIGATTDNLPPGVLYRVKATYKYTREDVDELSFEVGDVIRVVEYDDPEEQEEGWLMGIKETTGDKGMFPANFTRPL